eukprot:COSAG02_NODE_62_length_43372_cov_14.404710_2_plen_332_part_00
MGNCLKKLTGGGPEESSIDPQRLTFSDLPSDGATENFSSGVDDLFAEMTASVVSTLKSGTLYKLGGRGKDKWEERSFDLTSTGLSWAAPTSASGLKPGDIASVRKGGEVSGKPSFVVVSNVKGGKEYQLVAATVDERDEWVASIEGMLHPDPAALAAGGAGTTKQGSLLKLGGRNKDKWEPRDFKAESGGLVWSAKNAAENVLSSTEMIGVQPTAGTTADFELRTNVKGGKTYKLRAPSASARSEWLSALGELIESSGAKMTQMGDNGEAEAEPEGEPEPSAEELARLEKEKLEARAARKAAMAEKRKAAAAAAKAKAEAAAAEGEDSETV